MSKLFTMMLFAALMGVAGTNAAYAGCTVQGYKASGELVVLSLPCDFPIPGDTGDAAADQSAYEAELSSWGAAHPGEYEVLVTLTTVTNYNIAQSDFNGMSAERRAAIEARPDYYVVRAD